MADQASKLSIKTLNISNRINEAGPFNTPFEFNAAAKIYFAASTLSMAGLFTKARSKAAKLALSLYIGGSIGNYIDRFLYGGVTDFIKIGSWPVFNIADAAQVGGELLLLHDLLVPQTKELEPTQSKPSWPSILKNSFTKNIWNTLGQTFLYTIILYDQPFLPLALVPTILPALALSLIRDIRHRGERMF